MAIPADVQAVIATVRVVGKEFADVPDETVAVYVIMGRSFLDDPEYYKGFTMAQAYMACHLMWLGGLGTTSMGTGGNNQQTSGPIKSYKAGPLEIQYSDAQLSSSSSGSDDDEWLKKTSYGELLLLQLERAGMGGLTRWG